MCDPALLRLQSLPYQPLWHLQKPMLQVPWPLHKGAGTKGVGPRAFSAKGSCYRCHGHCGRDGAEGQMGVRGRLNSEGVEWADMLQVP